jgi:hypothetical protein
VIAILVVPCRVEAATSFIERRAGLGGASAPLHETPPPDRKSAPDDQLAGFDRSPKDHRRLQRSAPGCLCSEAAPHRPQFRGIAPINVGELRGPRMRETTTDKHRYPFPKSGNNATTPYLIARLTPSVAAKLLRRPPLAHRNWSISPAEG